MLKQNRADEFASSAVGFKKVSIRKDVMDTQTKTQPLFDAYTNHPGHIQFVQQHWLNLVKGFLELDFGL